MKLSYSVTFVSLLALSASACGGSDQPTGNAPVNPGIPALAHLPQGNPEIVLRGPSAEHPFPGFGEAQSDLGHTSQAIINGTVVPDRNVSAYGVVAIWAYVQQYTEWREVCTGTLLHNDLIITAKHCFTESGVAGAPFAFTYGPFNAVQVAAASGSYFDPNLDVALIQTGTPFNIGGSTTGWNRAVAAGQANRTALAIGYGNSISGDSSPPSSICHTGTQGCLGDPRLQRNSFHLTNWAQNATARELWVGPNNQNQFPTYGDSGSGLIDFYGNGTPVIGVYVAFFNASPPSYPTIHADYTPMQDIPWICSVARCM